MKLLNVKFENFWKSSEGELVIIAFILFIRKWQLELIFCICGFTFTVYIGDDGDT